MLHTNKTRVARKAGVTPYIRHPNGSKSKAVQKLKTIKKTNRVIIAAELSTHLGSVRPQNKPDNIWQLRPLMSLSRRYVNGLISAAELVTQLGTNSSQKPEHETQVWPLLGLTPDQAQQAWLKAVEKGGNRKITARMVEAAIKNLQLHPVSLPAKAVARKQRAERRQHAMAGMRELVQLIIQNASHATLLAKAEALAPLMNLFSTKPKSKK